MENHQRRVLLVDDEPSIIKMVSKRLQMEGFEVIVAMDGPEAVEKARTEKPDLIVLDLMLPTMNGFDVCKLLKQEQSAKEVPIIAMFTGKGDPGDEERCLAAGAAAYVTKNQGTSTLLAHVKTLLGE